MTDHRDRKYLRVYYNDLSAEYPEAWLEDAQLALYVRLLAVAEAMWPRVPEVPRSAKPRSFRQLVQSGLVVLCPPHGFRIRGLDAERNARRNAARIGAGTRWGIAEGNAIAMPNRTEPNREEKKGIQQPKGFGNGRAPTAVEDPLRTGA
jgi:hypothetical protein